MNSKERALAAINYDNPDRLPISHIWAYNYVFEKIFKELRIKNRNEFQLFSGEDLRPVQPVYIGPEVKCFSDGTREDIWGNKLIRKSFGAGFYEETVYSPFKEIYNLETAKIIKLPSPDWYDYSTIKEQCIKNNEYALFTGYPHYGDFINGTGHMAGVERTLLGLAIEDPVILYIFEKRFEYFYEILERTLKAAEGSIDIVFLGDDLGTQKAPLMSISTFKRILAPMYEKFFNLAHKYGAKTMLHSCGNVRSFIPLLIDIGLDILEGVQVDAENMCIEELHRDYYGKIVLCGSISVQTLLLKGTRADIIREVEMRKRLYSTGGMIIGPANGLQIDMPVENLVIMLNETKKIAGN